MNVDNVRIGVHPSKIRLVIDVSEVTDFRAFTLDSPYRLVIDLPNFSWQAGKVDRPAQAMISDIRQGALMPGVSRIVFDLEKPVKIETAFLLPQHQERPTRIVIDYKVVPKQTFNAHKSTIHGTLKIEDYENASAEPRKAAIPYPSEKPDTIARPKPLIIIDPGHGGQDPGALGGKGIYEKNIVLALAKDLRRELEKNGQYRVLMTRESDVFIRLRDRVKFARKHNGDLFVSIHADSIHKPNVRGTSVYTISKKASDAQTAKLAEKENQVDLMGGYDMVVEDEQVAFILGDFLMTDTMNQSKFFANTLVKKLRSHKIRTLQTPHRYAGFAVLKAPDIPSILIEAGFVSNREEARLLSQPSHRRKLAKAIHDGIDAYFAYVRNNERN